MTLPPALRPRQLWRDLSTARGLSLLSVGVAVVHWPADAPPERWERIDPATSTASRVRDDWCWMVETGQVLR